MIEFNHVSSAIVVVFGVVSVIGCVPEEEGGDSSNSSNSASQSTHASSSDYTLRPVEGDSLVVEEMIAAIFDSPKSSDFEAPLYSNKNKISDEVVVKSLINSSDSSNSGVSLYSSDDADTSDTLVAQLGEIFKSLYSGTLNDYLSYLQAISEISAVGDLESYSAEIGRGGCEVTAAQQKMMDVINAARLEERYCGDDFFIAVAPLTWNCKLENAAALHNDDMVQNNFFAHQGSNGLYAGDRVDAVGYNWRVYGENLAVGFTGEARATKALLASPGHCVNIMNGKVNEFGSVRILGVKGNEYGSYWTHVFGKEM